MVTIIFFLLGGIYGYLVLREGIHAVKNGFFNLSNVLLLVLAGLVYDNLVIGLGRFFGKGNLLLTLSYPRYWLHALTTPLLLLFGWNDYEKTVHSTRAIWRWLAFLLTAALIFDEWCTTVRSIQLKPVRHGGILVYEQADGRDFPLMILFLLLYLGIIGFLLKKKVRFPWLLIGVFLMAAGGALSLWRNAFPAINLVELVFVLTLVKTRHFQFRHQKRLPALPGRR